MKDGSAPEWILRADPATPADCDFLLRLFTSAQAVDPTGWPPEQAASFTRLQFDAQRRQYDQRFPESDHRIVMSHGEPVGQIRVDRAGEAIQIVDISLLPEQRRRGLGTALVALILAEAARARRPVGCHVLEGNLASQRLFLRLGFEIVDRRPPYLRLLWRPSGPPPAG